MTRLILSPSFRSQELVGCANILLRLQWLCSRQSLPTIVCVFFPHMRSLTEKIHQENGIYSLNGGLRRYINFARPCTLFIGALGRLLGLSITTTKWTEKYPLPRPPLADSLLYDQSSSFPWTYAVHEPLKSWHPPLPPRPHPHNEYACDKMNKFVRKGFRVQICF